MTQLITIGQQLKGDWSLLDNHWKANQGANSDLVASIREQILTQSPAHQNANPQPVNGTDIYWQSIFKDIFFYILVR